MARRPAGPGDRAGRSSRLARAVLLLAATAAAGALLPAPMAAAEGEPAPTTPGTRPAEATSSSRSYLTASSASVSTFYSAVGKVDLSVDGVGMTGTSGLVTVEKGPRATVRAAYLMSASTGFSGYVPRDGDVRLEGVPISWDPASTLANSIASYNVRADVTSIVKPVVDAAPAGRVELTVEEGPSSQLDGELLAVVLDDPDVPKTSTVALLYGAQNTAGDRIRLLQPLDKADPDLALRMSLGVSFGFQPAGQYSTVDVNGRRLSSSAGGQDDGEPANGALLTAGGVGDRLDNPADPYGSAYCSIAPRCDDEMYDLMPYVRDGDTTIDVATTNPSRDDNLFFAGFQLNAVEAIVGEGVLLTPGAQTRAPGSPVSLQALVQDSDGNPLAGRSVRLRVVAGPNAGAERSDTTAEDGTVSFGYSSQLSGRDELVADYVDDRSIRRASNRAYVEWGVAAPERWSGPFPLVGAHGITGVPEDMNTALSAARATVPKLRASGMTSSAPTSKTGSVWHNAVQLIEHADAVLDATGAPKVKVIAHSKGGLDTRVAMWFRPDLIQSLGMLATPNGGSKGANKLCALRRLGIDSVLSSQGPCDDDSDGLYNLQTSYVDDVINVAVRDYADRDYYIAAGNCSTRRTTFKCNAAANAVLDCDEGGDTAVCVESAFRRASYRSDGVHTALGPVFDADHSAMNRKPCPITRVLAELYPVSSVGNSWIDDGGATCERLPSASLRRSSASSSSAEASAPAPGTDVDQLLRAVPASPTSPLRVLLDPEGGDALDAEVYLPAGATADVVVTDRTGRVDTKTTVEQLAPESRFGENVVLVGLSGLGGQTRVLTVTPSDAGTLGLATTLPAGAPALEAVATAVGASTVQVTATLPGLASGRTARLDATATWIGPTGPVTVPLVRDPASGSFSAQGPVATGRHVPVTVTVTGDVSRHAVTGVVLADLSGRLTGIGADRLVDTDEDTRPDVLRIDVLAEVDVEGTYTLAVDLADEAGNTVTSAPGRARLAAGPGTLVVDVPLEALVTAGGSGPWRVLRAVLDRGETTRARVAEAADLGRTSAHDLEGLLASPTLSRPVATSVDQDTDGRYDVLRWTARATAPAAGDYRLTGLLRSPDGAVTVPVEQTVTLPAAEPLTVDLDGAHVGRGAPGSWTLTALTLTAVDDDTVTVRAATGSSELLDPRLWVGRTVSAGDLLALWNEAVAAGAVSPDGTAVAERERLERVRDAAADDSATAVAELGRFLEHLQEQERVAEPRRSQLASYATELRSALGG